MDDAKIILLAIGNGYYTCGLYQYLWAINFYIVNEINKCVNCNSIQSELFLIRRLSS